MRNFFKAAGGRAKGEEGKSPAGIGLSGWGRWSFFNEREGALQVQAAGFQGSAAGPVDCLNALSSRGTVGSHRA